MDTKDDIEKMFNDEIKEKKIIGRNVKYRGNRKYSGKVRFSSDYLTKYRNHYTSGGVTVSNVYDNITYKDLVALDHKERMAAIDALTKKFGNRKELAKHFEIKIQSIHDMYWRAKNTAKNVKASEPKVPKKNIMKNEEEVVEKKTKIDIIDSRFSLRLVSEMTGEELQERMMSLAGIILKSKKYQVSFELKEMDDKSKSE